MSDASPNSPAAAAARGVTLRQVDELNPPAWILDLDPGDPLRAELIRPYVAAHAEAVAEMARYNRQASVHRQIAAYVATYGDSVLGHLTAKVKRVEDPQATRALRLAACLWMHAHDLDFGLTARQLYPVGGALGVSASLIEAIARSQGMMRNLRWEVEYGEPIEWKMKKVDWGSGSPRDVFTVVKGENIAATLTATDRDGLDQALTITLDQAIRSGWASTNEKYASEPVAMLRARVRAAWVRAYAAPALFGLDFVEGEEESVVARVEAPGAPVEAPVVAGAGEGSPTAPEGPPAASQRPRNAPPPLRRMAGLGPAVEAPPLSAEDLEGFGDDREGPEPEPEPEPELAPPAPPPPAPEPAPAPPPAATTATKKNGFGSIRR